MTDRRALRNLAGLALIPVAAGVLGGSVTWAVGHDPMAATAAAPAPTAAPVAAPAPLPVLGDARLAELTAQVVVAQARIAQLQVSVDERVAVVVAAAAAPAVAPGAALVVAPVPAPPPLLDATTGASG